MQKFKVTGESPICQGVAVDLQGAWACAYVAPSRRTVISHEGASVLFREGCTVEQLAFAFWASVQQRAETVEYDMRLAALAELYGAHCGLRADDIDWGSKLHPWKWAQRLDAVLQRKVLGVPVFVWLCVAGFLFPIHWPDMVIM